jgi:nucleoside-diphosphate-sugar epimerase
MDEGLERLLKNPSVRFINVDLIDRSALDGIPTPVDRAYHLAAVVGVGPVERAPLGVMRTNTLTTLNVLDWFADNSAAGARLIYSSTSEVYSGALMAGFDLPVPTPEDVPVVISDIKNPRFTYAVSKIWGEAYARFLSLERGVHISTVRYHNVYGPGMGYDHVVPQVVKRVMDGENPFRIIGAAQTRSFCWIGDAAEAAFRLMESPLLSPGDIVNVGNSGGEISIGELYEMIFTLCGRRPAAVEEAEAPRGSVARRCPDTSFMERLTGYKPETPLSEGLKKTVQWYIGRTQ